jgi:hypothetical protein
MNVRNYSDNCCSCDALCCRVFEVQNIRGIQIKSIWDAACKYLERGNCRVYDSRKGDWLDICIEHSCLWIWPILTNWMRDKKIDESIPNIVDKNKLLAKVFWLMRDGIMDILEINDTRKINWISHEVHMWVLSKLEQIVWLIHLQHTVGEIQQIFDSNLRKSIIQWELF